MKQPYKCNLYALHDALCITLYSLRIYLKSLISVINQQLHQGQGFVRLLSLPLMDQIFRFGSWIIIHEGLRIKSRNSETLRSMVDLIRGKCSKERALTDETSQSSLCQQYFFDVFRQLIRLHAVVYEKKTKISQSSQARNMGSGTRILKPEEETNPVQYESMKVVRFILILLRNQLQRRN